MEASSRRRSRDDRAFSRAVPRGVDLNHGRPVPRRRAARRRLGGAFGRKGWVGERGRSGRCRVAGHVGVTWQLVQALGVTANVDHSYRAPNLDDLTSRQQTGARRPKVSIRGSSAARTFTTPRRSRSMEASLRSAARSAPPSSTRIAVSGRRSCFQSSTTLSRRARRARHRGCTRRASRRRCCGSSTCLRCPR